MTIRKANPMLLGLDFFIQGPPALPAIEAHMGYRVQVKDKSDNWVTVGEHLLDHPVIVRNGELLAGELNLWFAIDSKGESNSSASEAQNSR